MGLVVIRWLLFKASSLVSWYGIPQFQTEERNNTSISGMRSSKKLRLHTSSRYAGEIPLTPRPMKGRWVSVITVLKTTSVSTTSQTPGDRDRDDTVWTSAVLSGEDGWFPFPVSSVYDWGWIHTQKQSLNSSSRMNEFCAWLKWIFRTQK